MVSAALLLGLVLAAASSSWAQHHSVAARDTAVTCGARVALASQQTQRWWTVAGGQALLPRLRDSTSNAPVYHNLFEVTCLNKDRGEPIELGDSIALESTVNELWMAYSRDLGLVSRSLASRHSKATWWDVFAASDLNDRSNWVSGEDIVLRTAFGDDAIIVADGAELTVETTTTGDKGSRVGNKGATMSAHVMQYDVSVEPAPRKSWNQATAACWGGMSAGVLAGIGGKSASMSMIMVRYIPGTSPMRQCHDGVNQWWHSCGVAKPGSPTDDCPKQNSISHYIMDKRSQVKGDAKTSLYTSFVSNADFDANAHKWANCNSDDIFICCSPSCRGF